jgi:phosphoglycerate dehydrogenase-like enzyme
LKIAALDDWQDVARSCADWSRVAARADLVFLADAFRTEGEVAVALADFDILLTMRETAFPESLIRRLPKLRMIIIITGASNASLDVTTCTRQGITVCNTAGGGAGARALRYGRTSAWPAHRCRPRHPSADRTMRAWRLPTWRACWHGLAGKTLGIVGLGRLGAWVARYAITLDMNVIAWGRNLTEAKPGKSARASSANPISRPIPTPSPCTWSRRLVAAASSALRTLRE